MCIKGTGAEELKTALMNSGHIITRCLISSVVDHDHIPELLKKLNIPFDILSALTRLPIKNLYLTPDTLSELTGSLWL